MTLEYAAELVGIIVVAIILADLLLGAIGRRKNL